MKIAVIFGGKSGEHEISLVSAAAVARNIQKKHQIVPIGITKSGRWFLQSQSELERVLQNESAHFEIAEDESSEIFAVPGGKSERTFATRAGFFGVDVVFPVLHGTFGEDGTVQGLFEIVDVPYIGCSTGASAWTMDKEKTKALLSQAGIPVVDGICVRRSDFLSEEKFRSILDKAESEIGYPLFVKPCSAGSSNGAAKAANRAELESAAKAAFDWDDKILIEKAIDAREIECSVTGNPTTASGEINAEILTAYGPGEIAVNSAFYDYDTKYNDPNGASLLIPAALSEERLREIRETAKKAFAALDLSGLSRVDFFIDKKTDALFLNEINTMPGFTSISMFPKMCEKFGTDFEHLTELLIEQAIARFNATRKLKTSR